MDPPRKRKVAFEDDERLPKRSVDPNSESSEDEIEVKVKPGAEQEGEEEEVELAHTEALRLMEETLRPLRITIKLPEGRLVPRIPNRLVYVKWVARLIAPMDSKADATSIIHHVLDVGTGASAVYPLLGRSQFGWRCTGSDVDAVALEWARENVASNQMNALISIVRSRHSSVALQSLIRDTLSMSLARRPREQDAESKQKSTAIRAIEMQEVCRILSAAERSRLVNEGGPIFAALAEMGGAFASAIAEIEGGRRPDDSSPLLDAVMCNPPFYDEYETLPAALNSSGSAPNSSSVAGSAVEMRTVGGEAAFAASMIADSLLLQGAVGWFTCLLGKKRSLEVLVRLLRGLGVTTIATTRFSQSRRTHRWGLAWSFRSEAAAKTLSCGTGVGLGSTAPRMSSPTAFDEKTTLVPTCFRCSFSLSIDCVALGEDEIRLRLSESFAAQNLQWELFAAEIVVSHPNVVVWLSAIRPDVAAPTRQALDRFKGDVERTNRFWRRKQARDEGERDDNNQCSYELTTNKM